MPNNTLNLSRVRYLLWRDLRYNWKRDLLIIAGLLAFCFITYSILSSDGSIARNKWENEWDRLPDHWLLYAKIHFTFFPLVLLIGGAIFTSISFGELRHKLSRHFYLVIPATTGEKILSKWLITAILFPGLWLLVYQVFAQFTYHNFSNLGYQMVRLPVFDPWIWLWIGIYILAQSIFFLGAIALPRYSLIKISLILGGLIGLTLLLQEFSRYTLLPLFSEKVGDFAKAAASQGFVLEKFIMIEPGFRLYLVNQYPSWLLIIFSLVIFPMILGISYLKLKETEV